MVQHALTGLTQARRKLPQQICHFFIIFFIHIALSFHSLVLKVYVKPEPQFSSTLIQPSLLSIKYNLPSEQKRCHFFPWLAGRQTLSRRRNESSQLILLNIKSWINKEEGSSPPLLRIGCSCDVAHHLIPTQARPSKPDTGTAVQSKRYDSKLYKSRFSQAVGLVKEPFQVCRWVPQH